MGKMERRRILREGRKVRRERLQNVRKGGKGRGKGRM